MIRRLRFQCTLSFSVRIIHALLLASALLAFAAPAQRTLLLAAPLSVPAPPATFYGTVIVEGNAAAVDAAVTAWINGGQVAKTVTFLNNGLATYQINIPADDPDTALVDGGRAGDLIEFQVNGLPATPTAIWQIGALAQLNLTATAATITPTETVTATATLTATPTPSDTPTVVPSETPTPTGTNTPTPSPASLIMKLGSEPPAGTAVGADQLITYTVTLSQTSPEPQTNVVISAALPANASYITDSAQPQATYLPTSQARAATRAGTLTWRMNTVDVGESFQAHFVVRIAASPTNTIMVQVAARSDQTSALVRQTISHPFSPTGLEEETEPTLQRFFLPILLR